MGDAQGTTLASHISSTFAEHERAPEATWAMGSFAPPLHSSIAGTFEAPVTTMIICSVRAKR